MFKKWSRDDVNFVTVRSMSFSRRCQWLTVFFSSPSSCLFRPSCAPYCVPRPSCRTFRCTSPDFELCARVCVCVYGTEQLCITSYEESLHVTRSGMWTACNCLSLILFCLLIVFLRCYDVSKAIENSPGRTKDGVTTVKLLQRAPRIICLSMPRLELIFRK